MPEYLFLIKKNSNFIDPKEPCQIVFLFLLFSIFPIWAQPAVPPLNGLHGF